MKGPRKPAASAKWGRAPAELEVGEPPPWSCGDRAEGLLTSLEGPALGGRHGAHHLRKLVSDSVSSRIESDEHVASDFGITVKVVYSSSRWTSSRLLSSASPWRDILSTASPALEGREIIVPDSPSLRPSPELLDWHREEVFRR